MFLQADDGYILNREVKKVNRLTRRCHWARYMETELHIFHKSNSPCLPNFYQPSKLYGKANLLLDVQKICIIDLFNDAVLTGDFMRS
jgi:hypothetical protein